MATQNLSSGIGSPKCDTALRLECNSAQCCINDVPSLNLVVRRYSIAFRQPSAPHFWNLSLNAFHSTAAVIPFGSILVEAKSLTFILMIALTTRSLMSHSSRAEVSVPEGDGCVVVPSRCPSTPLISHIVSILFFQSLQFPFKTSSFSLCERVTLETSMLSD
jgi:hypothetical protein